MRLYSFTNMYTGGIHAGIQTAHVVHEMFRKYETKVNAADAGTVASLTKLQNLWDWADNHKTIIVKCAGYHESLVALYGELKEYSAFFGLPMGRFRESKAALNNAQTAVAIVVPKSIYDFRDPRMPMSPPMQFATTEDRMSYELQRIIDRYRMAS